jgi:hypothetical protein
MPAMRSRGQAFTAQNGTPNRIQRRLGHQSPADYEQHTAA